MWEMVSFLAAMVLIMLLIELFELPDWIRVGLKNGKSRKELELKVQALQSQLDALERKVNNLCQGE
jgi:hypothetical protein